ncbi:MAG TPA: nucleotide exchange factor GrpE, partial [Rhodoferax sp.]|nr:nucleotide exchange factor GrpE [Rhodoferax sp.]
MTHPNTTPPSSDPSATGPTHNPVDPAGSTADLPELEVQTLASCQAELVALQAKNHDLADQYLRAKADTENAR